tara:strand:+ start:2578 stop:2973 length:396 start_codon:yes stop_codon:yes gene_type:complete
MTWEIATTFGLVSVAIALLYLAFKTEDYQSEENLTEGQENRGKVSMSLRLIFITMAMGFLAMSLTSNIYIIEANNDTIGNANVSQGLIDITSLGFTVFSWTFWIFLLVTMIMLLLQIVSWVNNRGKRLRGF